MKTNFIEIKNAREHNLKDISLKIPRNKITVITGISGSGKSSLAFDTIYAEAQRRYLDAISSYAKQFINIIKKPEVESIEGLSPSIAINQRTITPNPRSTVGTMTGIYDLLRLLYSKLGIQYCVKCKTKISPVDFKDIIKEIINYKENTELIIYAPIVKGQKGEYSNLIKKLTEDGFSKILLDGKELNLNENIKIEKNKKHDLDLLIDKIIIKKDLEQRLKNSINLALKLSDGVLKLKIDSKFKTISTKSYCINCGTSSLDLEPRTFSFNSPKGACKKCSGLGFIEEKKCTSCEGKRLKEEALAIKINEKSIYEVSNLSLKNLKNFLKDLNYKSKNKIILDKILSEAIEKLNFLINVGLDYLSINRPSQTLSGGEAQRIRLGTQLGSGLTGILYVLDEPSIGLHASDNKKLLNALKELKNKKNTIIVIEHDEETIKNADHIIDLGPGAGVHGGNVVSEGTIQNIKANKNSLTGQFISKNKLIRKKENKKYNKFITLKNASLNNLKDLTVKIPKDVITTVTGVSGSGKSSLILDTFLIKALNHLNNKKESSITGLEDIKNIINVNQKPIGKTPRSNPATYTGAFNLIRNLFVNIPESRARGYKPGRFSFNVKGGRCEECQGQGQIKIELKFMSDVFVKCSSCYGKRFNQETLQIKYKDKNIYEVMDMTIEEAASFFKNIKAIYRKLKVLLDVGLAYLKLGQAANTLSGGETQRIKLSKELSKTTKGKTIYILDEPTTGLHFQDIQNLINIFYKLRDKGNTLIVIEHNLDIIKTSDYIIDLGPKGGIKGGYLIAEGPAEEIIKNNKSLTGKYLKEKINE
jgi:excinuclease ABC subunit A